MPELPQPQIPGQMKEPVIHTIPDQFYGAAAKAHIAPVARQAAVAAAPAPSRPPGSPPAPGAPAPAAPPKEGKKWLLIPIGAVVLLALMAFGAWWFLIRKPAAPASVPKTTVTLPPATTPPTPEPTPAPPEPTPEPTPAPEATTTPETPVGTSTTTEQVAPPPGPTPSSAPDQDNDGLSDIEETTIYHTDPTKSDSDNDGYSDSVEVINLYNPAGFKPTRLIDAGLVTVYDSTEGKYQIYYPTTWSKTDRTGGEVVFNNPQSQPVAVSIEPNPDGKSVLDWYLTENPSASPADVQQFFTKSGLEGVRSPDELTSYIAGNGKIYIIAYAPGLQTDKEFRSTYIMMVNSFMLKP